MALQNGGAARNLPPRLFSGCRSLKRYLRTVTRTTSLVSAVTIRK